MQAKKRYLLFVSFCAFLAGCYLGRHRLKGRRWKWKSGESLYARERFPKIRENPSHPPSQSNCRMETCFNFTRCSGDFKVYVYPDSPASSPSEAYLKILNVIRGSSYYTADPEAACLFVLSLDTLDRDPLSNVDFVRNMPTRFAHLKHWAGGTNHVIFNLYSGTYPDYAEDLNFDPGHAILAKASISNSNYRPDFDVSLPLFHKFHPEKGGEEGTLKSHHFPVKRKHFLAFKGKRYVYGIGSETRNSLHHLHNGKDLVLVTTCKHGKNWKELKDERCDEDNREFDRWDYNELLSNSTFCLVPRGRRLGSFRFLETLQAGCVPVVLSNGWVLPFSEIIDWSTATILADERLLLQVPEILRSIPTEKTFAMRKQTQIYWNQYLSSVEKIVSTTLEIIRSRISRRKVSRESHVWNSSPGGLHILPEYSCVLGDFPFYRTSSSLSSYKSDKFSKFTAVIFVTNSPPYKSHIHDSFDSETFSRHSQLHRLIRKVSASSFVERIVVVWRMLNSTTHFPSLPSLNLKRRIPVHLVQVDGISGRFLPSELIETEAILSLDEDSLLTTEEIDFAFGVWKNFPDRIVGYPGRSHYWDESKKSWAYSSKWVNEISMVLTGSAFYHKYYHTLYWNFLPTGARELVDSLSNCEDILMNFLVSHVTKKPPIKVTQRKKYKDSDYQKSFTSSSSSHSKHFIQRQTCINAFVTQFGYMPLKKSILRLDPILFKDPVSNARKKYKKIDNI